MVYNANDYPLFAGGISPMEKIKKIMQRIGLALKGFAQRIAIEAKQTVLDLKEGKNLKKHLYRFLILVFAVVFIISSTFVVRYLIQSYKHKQQMDYLQGLHGQDTRPTTPTLRPSTDDNFTFGDVTWPWGPGGEDDTQPERPTGNEETTPSGMLKELEALYKINNDVVGYIYVPGTNINYPVLQRSNDKDYYLYRDMMGKSDNHGSIYVREACDVFEPSDNVTIYGHNMGDGTMFAHVHKYRDKDFFKEHPVIYFDTLYERHTYQVLCIFRTSGTYGVGYPYHTFDDFSSESEFKSFVKNIRKLAMHDSGISVSYGDKFICLSTCEEWPIENGRLVLVAVRID